MAAPYRPITRRAALGGLAASVVPLAARAQSVAAPDVVLRARPVRANVPGAAGPADLWLLGDAIDPPVLRLRHREELRVSLVNDTPSPLSMHWYGVRGPNATDGVGGLTEKPLGPGETRPVRFTPPDPGTFLLRPCLPGTAGSPGLPGSPGRSGELAGRGLAALLVVEEREPPKVDAEFAVLVRDWLTDESGALASFGDARPAAGGGRLGNVLTAAGAAAPHRVTAPPGARVRLRLANGSNARVLRLRFDGAKVFVAAVDGQPTETFEPLRASVPFAPGSRFDILFDMPAEPDGIVSVVGAIGAGLPLVEVRAAGDPVPAAGRPPIAAPPLNPALPPEIRLQNAVRRDIVLGGGAARNAAGDVVYPPAAGPIWTVNGAPGRLDGPPLLSARRGQPVVLGIQNATGFPQPLHLHGHVARLLHPLDDGWEPYWSDTFQVPEGKTVRIAFAADNPGRWLLGSSVLERLDTGLFGVFEVT